jgi:hypothetical protein
VLDLLKKLGVTSEVELRARLKIDEEPKPGGKGEGGVDDAVRKLVGSTPDPTPPVPDPTGVEPAPSGNGGAGTESGSGRALGGGARGDGDGKGPAEGSGQTVGKRTSGSAGGRPFISYVAAHPDDEEADPDGLEHDVRMALEARAIDLIIAGEPDWQRTKAFNPGFDLFQAGLNGQPSRWCEVKAMTGSLRDRPVGLSRTQFDCAREHGDAYWLYVVERASATDARIVRIQDPAGKAHTFTFDRGWLDIADVDAEQEHQED